MTCDESVVWCTAVPSLFGTGYALEITYNDDHVLTLGHDDLLRYVDAFVQALSRGRYVEAVRRQLTERGVPIEHVIGAVQDLRADLPELPGPFGGRYRIREVVTVDGRAEVQVLTHARGETEFDVVVVQFEAVNIAEHVLHVMDVYAVADLDNAYARYLRGTIGVDSQTVAGVIGELAEYRPRIPGLDSRVLSPARGKPAQRSKRKRR